MKKNIIIDFFRNLKIKNKILLLVLFFTLIIITVGLVSFFNLRKLSLINIEIIKKIEVNILKCHKLKNKIEEIHMNTVSHILSMDNIEKNKIQDQIILFSKEVFNLLEELKVYHENQNQLDIKNDKLKKNINADIIIENSNFSKYYIELINQWNKYIANIELIFQISNNSDKENAFNVYIENNKLIFGKVIEILDLILIDYDKEIILLKFSSDKAIKSTNINLSLIMISGIILSIIFSILIVSTITNPLKKVVNSGNDIALGVLPDEELNIKNKDEIGIVANVFNNIVDTFRNRCSDVSKIAEGDLTIKINAKSDNDVFSNVLIRMINALNILISNINNSVVQVSNSSMELAGASQSLSQGATEQASSLEEISSSIEELLSQVKNNAENAVEASSLSKNSMKNAEYGNDQMSGLIKAMGNINKSADDIKKIIKVIDEIAFQTNILSLNANVEAARAGKYGKGFAVVAEEVRNLSSRSAKSVLETTTIVEETIKNIQDAYKLVEITSLQLEDIVKSTLKVAELVEEIAIASQEQTQGLDQINQGLILIEQVTQSNTSNAEETASASEELASQAQQLKTAVEKFKIVKKEDEVPVKKEIKSIDLKNSLKKESILTQDRTTIKKKNYLDKLNKIKEIKNKPKVQAQIEHFDKDDTRKVDIKAQKILVNPKKIIKLDDADFGKF